MPVKMDDVMVRTVIHMHSGAWPAQFGLQLYCGYGHGEGMVGGKQEALRYNVYIQSHPACNQGLRKPEVGAFRHKH